MELIQEREHYSTTVLPQILIMEDEVSVAKGLEVALTENGYIVDLAMTGKSALDSFRKKYFDLLVADLRLPDIDGMEVIKKVKNERPDTGVIVITGYSTIPSAVESMRLGAYDYLPKPFTEEEFMAVVKDALEAQKPKFVEAPEIVHLEPLPEDLLKVKYIINEMEKEYIGAREEVIPMLRQVQNNLGYIPETALEEIARLTKMPPASVYGIATFYEQFRLHPIGKHVVKVCRGTACHVKGAELILNEIKSRFDISPGETSEDRSFTLETVACFGSCAIAPVVVVDDKVKGRMNPKKAIESFESIRFKDKDQ